MDRDRASIKLISKRSAEGVLLGENKEEIGSLMIIEGGGKKRREEKKKRWRNREKINTAQNIARELFQLFTERVQ
jgi:hypothetical protein